MTLTDDVFRAADGEGLGLTEYISKMYSQSDMTELEHGIRSQLNTLKSEISDFMETIEVPEISMNLETTDFPRLDLMQSRIKSKIESKQSELISELSNAECLESLKSCLVNSRHGNDGTAAGRAMQDLQYYSIRQLQEHVSE